MVVPIRVLSRGQIYLFKNYSYSIKQQQKKKKMQNKQSNKKLKKDF